MTVVTARLQFNVSRPQKINYKKYFCANSKDSEVVKSRFCAKSHTREIQTATKFLREIVKLMRVEQI